MQGQSVISVIVSREVYTQGDEMKGSVASGDVWQRMVEAIS